jgi:hypothetical protein
MHQLLGAEKRQRHLLNAVIERWNSDLKISLQQLNDDHHILVSYEQLVENPGEELTRLCEFVQIRFEPQMLRHEQVAEAVVGWRSKHPWMQKPFEPLENTRLKKFSTIFTRDEQKYITEHLLYGGEVVPAIEATLRPGRDPTKPRQAVLI